MKRPPAEGRPVIEFVAGKAVAKESGEALAVPVLEDLVWGLGADWVAKELGGWLEPYLEQTGFTGKLRQVAAVPTGGKLAFATVYFVGLGAEVDREALRRAAGWLGRAATKVADLATTLHMVDIDGSAAAMAEGFVLGQYRFDEYRSEPKPSLTRRLRLLGRGATKAVGEAERARRVVEAVVTARDLVNRAAVDKPPAVLADLVAAMGAARGIEVTAWDEEAIREGGLGGLLGVSAGAHQPPRLVEMRYRPAGAVASLALVGKGIVFDSGGLSIKPADGMETMKDDMAGAAAVITATLAIADLGLPVKVTVFAPLTENMPGGGATRPGDVLRARNGKTIEVLNTDAEGRLVLADGLALAAEEHPDLTVDVATLTGAARVALGSKVAAMLGNDDQAVAMVEAAAARAGERVWRLPLVDEYRKLIDSDVADMKNTGGRYGGAINAALLLAEFVGDGPWVHLDIAGPAWSDEEEHYLAKGGTGFGVRTLVALAEDLAGGDGARSG